MVQHFNEQDCQACQTADGKRTISPQSRYHENRFRPSRSCSTLGSLRQNACKWAKSCWLVFKFKNKKNKNMLKCFFFVFLYIYIYSIIIYIIYIFIYAPYVFLFFNLLFNRCVFQQGDDSSDTATVTGIGIDTVTDNTVDITGARSKDLESFEDKVTIVTIK